MPSEPSPAADLARLRDTAPLIHNITNLVAMTPMANVLLAVGASPAMGHAREEVADLTALAGALTVNIGTPSPHWAEAMVEAAEAAGARGTPWVLDPVAVGATPYRRRIAGDLLARRPTVIRGNASEIRALVAEQGSGRGVDSTDSTRAVAEEARRLAERTGSVVAVTGEADLVTDGPRAFWVHGGDPLMARVTALGCALTGVVAAFVAAEGDDALAATASALACYAAAGEQAAEHACGPGSFSGHFLDTLYGLTGAGLDERLAAEPARTAGDTTAAGPRG